MDSNKTFYIFNKIRNKFPCVVCSGERPLVEEQRGPEPFFGVLAGQQYNKLWLIGTGHNSV